MTNRPKQSIGLNFDARCNAECAHCCVSSSPRAKSRLNEETIWRIVDDAVNHPDVIEVGLTGGEPLLRVNLALDIIRTVSKAGKRVTCVSNAYWARTPATASEMFDKLGQAGLDSLTISYDEFHADDVPLDTIKNALNASKASHIPVILNMAVSRSRDSFKIIVNLGAAACCVPITRFPIVPAGAARDLPDSEFEREPITESSYRCPGFELILHHDGNAYPCCSPVIFDTPLTLGKVETESIETLITKVERNAVLSIIQREGLGWFKSRIAEALPESDVAKVDSVVSACELCGIIFSDESYVRAIKSEILDYAKVVA